jgi:RNA polymerase sigma-70 factor (ECF subfamily)
VIDTRGQAESRRVAPANSNGEQDLEWFLRARNGDVSAFEQLYRVYHPRLVRFLARLVRRPPLIEEVLNDTLMVVWERGDSFAGGSKLSTWIFGIAYRKAMNALHRQDEPVEDHDWAERVSDALSPEEESAQARRRQLLARAIDELSPDHRMVVELTYHQEMGYNEIASIMDCPVGTVKTRMLHARRHLRRRLAGELEDWV